jgi:hypothetical protein
MPAYPMTDEPVALPIGGVRTLIRDLGGDENPSAPPYPYTGAIHLHLGDRKKAALWLYDGVMYSAHLQGYDPPVALRLKTARLINEQQYQELLGLPSSDAGPEAVDRNWVPAYIVEELHREIMLATLSHLYDWDNAHWWWQEDETTELFVTSGLPLMLASAAVDERIGQWKAVTRAYPNIVKPKSVPHPGPVWGKRHLTMLSPELESVLNLVNGQFSIAEIAAACGLTRFEMARLLSQATAFGVISFAAGDTIASAPAPTPEMRHPDELHYTTGPDSEALSQAPPPRPRRSSPENSRDYPTWTPGSANPAPPHAHPQETDHAEAHVPDAHLGESAELPRTPRTPAAPPSLPQTPQGERGKHAEEQSTHSAAQELGRSSAGDSENIETLTHELDEILARVSDIRKRIDDLQE